jgi:hypothetical protein
MATPAQQHKKVAQLKMTSDADGQVLTAAVPRDITGEDFTKLGHSILGLIKGHTGCNCLSGRIKVVIQEDYSEVIRVDLG